MSTTLTLLSIVVTIGAYALGRRVAAKYPSPLTTPVFFSTTLIVLVLLASGVEFDAYRPARDMLIVLLGPATVALAVPVYKTRHVLAAHAVPALAGIVAGVVSTVGAALALGYVFGFHHELLLPLGIKSITAPIAVELAKLARADITLTAAMVIATGMVGAMFGQWLMNRAGITHPLARGLALGTIAHGQGTAQAVSEGELQGAIAGIAMSVTAVLASVALPLFLRALT